MAVDLLLNLCLLVALTVVSTFFWRRFDPRETSGAIIQGCLFGAAAVIGMIRPMVIAPGLIFDGRSMMLSLCALFFGPRAALAAMIAPVLYRAGLGGPGVYMGVLTIFSSAAVGLFFHHRWHKRPEPPSTLELLWFGLLVHVAMLAMSSALPAEVRWATLKRMALPILLVYPLVTVLAGKVLADNARLSRMISALQHTNQRLDITLRSIADGVIATDLQGRIVTMNPTAEQLTGWPADEATGRPIQEIFPIFNEQTGKSVENPVHRVLKEGRVVGLANHTVLRSRQGREHPIADSAAPIMDNRNRCCGVVLVFRDQTREREARNALIESETRYRTLVESAPALIWRCDAQGNFDYFNQRWLAFRGRPLAEEQGRRWHAGVHPEDWLDYQHALEEAFRQQRPWQATYRLQRHDGQYRWLQEEAVPIGDRQGQHQGYIGFCLDITEQHESLERERLLISALEASAACVFLADAAGFIEWVNPAFAANLRLARESVPGKSWEDFFQPSPQTQAESYDSIMALLLAGQTWRGELQARRAGGELFSADFTLSPLTNPRGQLIKVVGVFEDLTQRKAMEEELRQAQKLDIMGQVASGVAHDFNNLLTTIQLCANMLDEHPALPDSAREDVRDILASAEKGAKLTGQLLSFARRDPVRWEELDLNEVVKTFENTLKRLIGAEVTLVTQLAKEPLRMRGDRNRLEQIIMNLAVNARDAMPKGGTLLMETALVETPGPLTLASTLPKEGPFVALTFQDTGCGMTPEILSRIFDPFFTTKPPGKGTGIGLTVVSTILRDLCGGLQVESQPGQGTTFRLYFPVSRSSAALPATAREIPAHGGGETILLVEDENLVRDLTAKSLRRLGYQVLSAAHAAEALQIFKQHPHPIHLLLTDILLPDNFRGDRLAEQLQAMQPSLKVIFMSGFPGETPAAKPDYFKDKTFLSKPFTPRQLALTVRQVLQPRPDSQ
ncbi:PAS domain S-box protein [Fontisphaera persica]|uniref:PAS domain S-box protein n=1 Tax=Fontisphaera persica TaxID=2974023 RepID=UPI0024C00813|nr:PAS domain S-box protein [Fontisphaera persica]WCJ58936.1 PAS domain S-box protein [Fontisphaera persica]